MTQIIKTTNSLSTQKRNAALMEISNEHQEIIKCALAPQIANLTPASVTDEMIDIISAALSNSGSKVDPKTAMLQANETYSWLIKKYPEVTVSEIREAIRAGVYEEYGEYFGLNPKAYVFFVESYLKSERRRLATAAFETAKSRQRGPVPEMTDQAWRDLILRDYELMKSGETELIVFFPHKYIFLRQNGLLGLKSLESWHNWLWRAKNERLWTGTRSLKKKGEITALQSLKNIYAELEVSGTIPVDEFKRLVFGARKLRYLGFLEYHVRKGEESELLNAFCPK